MTAANKRKKKKQPQPAGKGKGARVSRKRRATPGRRRHQPKARRPRFSFVIKSLLIASLVLLAALSGLFAWGLFPQVAANDAEESRLWLRVNTADPEALAEQLSDLKLVDSAFLMELYLRVMVPSSQVALREHALQTGLTPREISARLTGDRGRAIEVVTLREGLNSFEMGAILEKKGVCYQAEFQKEVFNTFALAQLGIIAPSAEGWLFPATYEFRADSSARQVVELLVKEGQSRFQRAYQQVRGRLSPQVEKFTRLFGLQGILTLASIIEKEAASQRAQVSEVFYNRLDNLKKETSGRLQSDPTALYGCHLRPQLPSCAGNLLKVTPRMLRDPTNPYNTYRNSGLPPGPISNPGEAAFSAALKPSLGESLYFFADGQGQHLFSLTYAEHKRKIAKRASRRSQTIKTGQ